jgi:excisionase family DNA binding protein
MSQESIVVSKKIAAQMLSVSLRTIDHLIAAKELAIRKIGRRVVVPRQSLSDFILKDHPTRSSKAHDDRLASTSKSVGCKKNGTNAAKHRTPAGSAGGL